MKKYFFEEKKVLVCGMARSGQAAAKKLHELGATVTVTDSNKETNFDNKYGLTCLFGQDPFDFVHEFELIIISPGISVYAPFVKKAVSLGIPVWGEVELFYILCPCPIIAITGTNGKTTVTTLVGKIMKLKNNGTVIAGNIGLPLTEIVSDLKESDLVVAEISSFQLETVQNFRPKISAILNMTEDHLDRHGTMQKYIEEKTKIFQNQGQDDVVVLNYDNSITKNMKPPSKAIYFSTHDTEFSSVYLRDGNIFVGDEVIMPISKTKVLAENALAATAIAYTAGATKEQIAKVLEEFNGVDHRLEYVTKVNNVSYYNDSKATNVDSTIKALESFKNPVILIAGGYDKNTDFTPLVKLFSKNVKHLFLIGQTASQLAKTCKDLDFNLYTLSDTLENAVFSAKNIAASGDTILFSPACASFDQFKNFEERGEKFKEYILYGKKECTRRLC